VVSKSSVACPRRFASQVRTICGAISFSPCMPILPAITRSKRLTSDRWVLTLAVVSFIIHRSDPLTLNDVKLSLPLPNILLQFIPGFNAIHISSLFSVMLTFAMAVLAGYGTRDILQRVARRTGPHCSAHG
jgi:hypothetical protein